MATEVKDEELSRLQLAARLGKDPKTIWSWVHNGIAGVKLRAIAIGGRPYFRMSDVNEFNRQVAVRKGWDDEPAAEPKGA